MMSISINGTLILESCQPRQFLRQMSPSTNVCIYSGTRFAPIHVPNSASSVCITIFFLWHMCVMFYIVTCHVLHCNMYCMLLYDIPYSCSNSYSVLLWTPLTLYDCSLQYFLFTFWTSETDSFGSRQKFWKIDKTHTTPFHPRSDGQTERMNRTLLQMLRTTASDNANNWPSFLPALMSAYRMTTHSVTGATPNLAMLGRKVLIPATLIAQPPDEPSKPVTHYVTTFRSTIRDVHVTFMSEVKSEYWNLWDFST